MEFVIDSLWKLLAAAVTALGGYIGIVVKNLYKKYVNDKTKQDVAKTCVKAIEQIYKDLHGEDKLNKALEAASEMLESKNISVTEVELRLLIESAVAEFNEAFNKSDYSLPLRAEVTE